MDKAQGFYGEQIGIAGTGADEVDLATFGGVRWGAARRLKRGIANLPICNLVKERLARLAGRMRRKNVAAKLAEICEPGAKIVGQLLVDFTTEALGNSGTFPGC